jgi:putative tryptophan/tyrosine transport system substrate-binding protein
MRRREFIVAIGAAALWPRTTFAQASIRKIGFLSGIGATDPEAQSRVTAFRDTLATLGWKQGETIHIEYRWAGADPSRVKEEAAALAKLAPDVLIGAGTLVAQALKATSPTTPIVFVNVVDPIQSGLVSSFARPGGNLTGFTNYDLSISGKWLEILREIAPTIRRVLVILNPENSQSQRLLEAVATVAKPLNIDLVQLPSKNAAELSRGFAAFGSSDGNGVLVLPDFTTTGHRDVIVESANRARWPGIYPFRLFAASGGLAAYGIDQVDMFRKAATYADRILRGTSPGALPVQGPTKFELVLNLKTARSIGVGLPASLLARADEVIE